MLQIMLESYNTQYKMNVTYQSFHVDGVTQTSGKYKKNKIKGLTLLLPASNVKPK